MYDIVIIGAGTAGLSAAIYARRAGKKVLVLEENYYGGQIVNTPHIENYPGIKQISGFDFAYGLYEQAKELGMEIAYTKAEAIRNTDVAKEVVTATETYPCRAIILATGAKNRMLGLQHEKELTGKGVSYCATCDGAFYRGKTVAVAGGGNTALEDAIHLAQGCKKVYLIHRRAELRAEQHLQDRLSEKENIILMLESRIVELVGENSLEGIVVEHLSDNQKEQIKVDGLFIAIGQEPDNYRFQDMVDLDEKGYIVAKEDCKTSMGGVFAAGDCRTKTVRQLTTAAADGAVAALAACEYIG